MTRDEALALIQARADGARIRYVELLMKGVVRQVVLSHVDRPALHIRARSWEEALQMLGPEKK